MWSRFLIYWKSLDKEWLFIKIPFAYFCFSYFIFLLDEISSVSVERGICSWIDCHFFLNSFFQKSIIITLAILFILYLFEIWMVFVTLFISIIAFGVLSAHESFGIQQRTGILVLIWFAQFIAYFIKSFSLTYDIRKNRIFLPVQVIVACYTLSGLSKLYTSGFSWFMDSQLLVLQILKTNQVQYINGQIALSEIYSSIVHFVLNHGDFMSILLMGALFIETTSGMALINKKVRILYGVLLLSMHIGIVLFFHIQIRAFIVPMILFMLNPFFLAYDGMSMLFRVISLKLSKQASSSR